MARLGLQDGKFINMEKEFHGAIDKDFQNELSDTVLRIEYERFLKEKPEYKNVSYNFFRENAYDLANKTKKAESNSVNLSRGTNKLDSTASGMYQILKGSVPTAYNRATNRFFTGEQSKIFEPILKNNDSSVVPENVQDALFFSNIFESKGSDNYLIPALLEGNKEASMNAYLYNHHTLSSKVPKYNQQTIDRAKKIWKVN